MSADSVILCRSRGVVAWRTVAYCPTCVHRRRMLAEHELWAGTTRTCLTCGDAWSDGERLPRPFARGWRAEAVAQARTRARRAVPKAEAARLIGRAVRKEGRA